MLFHRDSGSIYSSGKSVAASVVDSFVGKVVNFYPSKSILPRRALARGRECGD